MDRALDDIIGDRDRRPNNNNRNRDRRPPRDGVKKTNNRRDEPRNLDSDWVHDRYDDDDSRPRRGGGGGNFYGRSDRRQDADFDLTGSSAKIKIENLHYDLTEEDLRDLFGRKGDVQSVQLLYDRQDRSRGTAYVVMKDSRDARDAVRDFDGANANGQPIAVSMVASGPSGRPRNPFDTAERPSRSLFDRVEKRSRSESPQARHRRGAPDNVDRYTPGERGGSRRRSPRRGGGDRRGGGGGGGSRRPGERRGRGGNTDAEGNRLVQGRPRKTQEELDAEMEDYWGTTAKTEPAATAPAAAASSATTGADAVTTDNVGDVDMVE